MMMMMRKQRQQKRKEVLVRRERKGLTVMMTTVLMAEKERKNPTKLHVSSSVVYKSYDFSRIGSTRRYDGPSVRQLLICFSA